MLSLWLLMVQAWNGHTFYCSRNPVQWLLLWYGRHGSFVQLQHLGIKCHFFSVPGV
jgi:hypothetical protein